MKLGFVGLGRMGGSMVLQLLEKGHEVVVFNRTAEKTKNFIGGEGNRALGVYLVKKLVEQLPSPYVIWLMIQAGKLIDDLIKELLKYLKKGDVIIDGGNSYFKDSIRRGTMLAKEGIHFVDVGTSGGISGAREGACMMIGGEKEIFRRLESLFRDMCVTGGYGYMGKSGAGHFVKMVHNGIEYGMMSAIGEGVNAIKAYEKRLDTNVEEALKVYSHGSIIESKLVAWTLQGMERNYFKSIAGSVPKGETEEEMKKLTALVEMPVLKQAIKEREKTRKNPSFFGKIIAIIRNKFGGHAFGKNE